MYTALYAAALAAARGAHDVDGLFAIVMGGLFADIAKLELPTEMLMRQGPLTADEWRQVHQHPERSVQIMRWAGVVTASALRGALSHHERWDGDGYPDRLRGEEIPFEARCVAIADAYSAMTVDRAFQARADRFDALMEMAGKPRGQFDPALLRSFISMLGAARGTEESGPAAQPEAGETESAAA